MSNRYATIITDDDGREVVSAIGVFEGAAPQAHAGRIEPVAPGVLIGMVRGDPVDAVGGFGFPRGAHGVDGRAVALARASLKALPTDKGDAPAKAAGAAARKATRRPAKAKRRKAGKIKRPAKQAAATAALVGVPDHG